MPQRPKKEQTVSPRPNSVQNRQKLDKTITNQKKRIVKKRSSASLENSNNDNLDLKKHKQWKETLVLDKYMGSFIKKATTYSFYCLKCKEDIFKKTGKKDMWCENVYSHILSSTHEKNTPNEENNKYESLKSRINSKKNKKGDDIEES